MLPGRGCHALLRDAGSGTPVPGRGRRGEHRERVMTCTEANVTDAIDGVPVAAGIAR